MKMRRAPSSSKSSLGLYETSALTPASIISGVISISAVSSRSQCVAKLCPQIWYVNLIIPIIVHLASKKGINDTSVAAMLGEKDAKTVSLSLKNIRGAIHACQFI